MRAVALLLMCAACGRIGFDDRPSTDADASLCTWGPFSAPVHVPELSSVYGEFATAISADNRTIVFDSDRPGGMGDWDLWQATRTDALAPFFAPAPLTTINSVFADDNPALSPDGNTIYFSSNRTGTARIFVATRADPAQAFGPPVQLTGPITSVPTCCPSLTPDQQTIYVTVDNPDEDVDVATRPDVGSDFSTPTELTALSTPANDLTPSIAADDLELFFQTNRVSGNGFDIFVARRASRTESFAPPVTVAELSTAMFNESDPTISFDGRTLWFGILSGPASLGGGDIYYATRDCQ